MYCRAYTLVELTIGTAIGIVLVLLAQRLLGELMRFSFYQQQQFAQLQRAQTLVALLNYDLARVDKKGECSQDTAMTGQSHFDSDKLIFWRTSTSLPQCQRISYYTAASPWQYSTTAPIISLWRQEGTSARRQELIRGVKSLHCQQQTRQLRCQFLLQGFVRDKTWSAWWRF